LPLFPWEQHIWLSPHVLVHASQSDVAQPWHARVPQQIAPAGASWGHSMPLPELPDEPLDPLDPLDPLEPLEPLDPLDPLEDPLDPLEDPLAPEEPASWSKWMSGRELHAVASTPRTSRGQRIRTTSPNEVCHRRGADAFPG
jgi:hypothetical protein